ncbi:MAG: beta-galactosidase trimerization domain-containing protein [Myxococcales bacterium]|nr:beta-galactosidase trimerization domain-containing protein [Myxococcales bacterium]
MHLRTYLRLSSLGCAFLIALSGLAGCDDSSNKQTSDGGQDSGRDGGDVQADGSTVDGSADGGDDASTPRVPHVLVLNDSPADELADNGDPAGQLVAALEAADIVAVNAGYYPEWDGATPSLTDVDVVVWFEGSYYGETIMETMDSALQAFVNGGGTLVRTEWGGYSIDEEATGINTMMPTFYDGGYAYSSTWSADMASHPYLSGITFPFATLSGHSYMVTTENAVTIASLTNNESEPVTTPAVTEKAFGAGKVIHVNHDVLYTIDTLEPELLKLFVNIANASIAD